MITSLFATNIQKKIRGLRLFEKNIKNPYNLLQRIQKLQFQPSKTRKRIRKKNKIKLWHFEMERKILLGRRRFFNVDLPIERFW